VSPALIGLIGVIAGALLTGGIQAVVGRNDRRLAARASARLLGMHLDEAREGIVVLHDTSRWDPVTDWQGFATAWRDNSAALARTLGTVDFLVVARAFANITSLARARATQIEEREMVFKGTLRSSPTRIPPFEVLDDFLATNHLAHETLLAASFTRRERRRGDDLSAPPSEAVNN
jgi:hypothetical protein